MFRHSCAEWHSHSRSSAKPGGRKKTQNAQKNRPFIIATFATIFSEKLLLEQRAFSDTCRARGHTRSCKILLGTSRSIMSVPESLKPLAPIVLCTRVHPSPAFP